MKRKWVSCSTEGRATFSLDLLEEASSFQDYGIVHALIHLKVPNHGKLFSSLLSAHLHRHECMAKPEVKLRSLLNADGLPTNQKRMPQYSCIEIIRR